MVLSNRKLKQQLREKISDSLLTFEIVKSDPTNDGSATPDPNPPPQSMRALLESVAPKPRLSKRAVRRKIRALRGPEASGSGGGNCDENQGEQEKKETGDEKMDKKRKRVEGNSVDLKMVEEKEVGVVENNKKEKKKRKRDEEKNEDLGLENKSGDLGFEENGDMKEAKKPKKKKPKWKKKKEAKSDEEKKGVEVEAGSAEQVAIVKEAIQENDRQANVEVATKAYVGGIPYYSTEDDIRSYFETCGTITEIDCMRFPDSGKFKGIAIISFRTEAAAKRALALDGADMGGLFLKIQPYKSTRANKVVNKVSDFAPKIVEGYNRIYAGNLSWDITEDELRRLFSDCKISSINFGMDKDTGEFRGYAHVDFSDGLSLTKALQLDQKIVLGRPVKISCAVPLRKAGTHSNSLSTTTGTLSDSVASPASAAVGDAGLSAVSGKIKRRTCYECGEKGHISSLCPKKQSANVIDNNAIDTNATYSKSAPTLGTFVESVTTSTEPANAGLSSVDGKIKRRTCYECGEKGHVSTACPLKQSALSVDTYAVFTAPVRTTTTDWEPVDTTTNLGSDYTGLNSGSGKIKRRTCYECGEKGHVSTACPLKQSALSVETNATYAKSLPTTATALREPVVTITSTEPDSAGFSSISGKIKRRTCYECGAKGHISSACPQKQSTDNNVS